MPATKATPPRGQISRARVVPLHIETAKQFGGGARGRTLAIIYRQLCYWSKYAKWKGKNGKKFFYKSADELSQELGLVVVEQLHKRYWRQVNFFYLPHSPFAAAELTPSAPVEPAPQPPVSAPVAPVVSCSTTTKPSSFNAPAAPGGAVHPAATAAATSIRARGGRGFGPRVPIQQREYKPFIKQSLQAVVERCYAMGEYLKKEQEEVVPIS